MKPAASGGFDTDVGGASDDAGGRGVEASGDCPMTRLAGTIAMPARIAVDMATYLGARGFMVSFASRDQGALRIHRARSPARSNGASVGMLLPTADSDQRSESVRPGTDFGIRR
jgi:hypothetical protein